jgi:ATP-dependent exoDNAse (exonuclease V) beta subunit
MSMRGKLTFISAGAGSGKTHRLTQILHQQLTSGDVRPSGVIATTFTKKAAAELRERVRSYLLKQGNYALANAMGQARIGTVNSVCGGLLERFAFEAGLATEQQVLEESQAAIFIKQAIDSVCNGPDMTRLLKITRRLSIEDWQGEMKGLIDKARANDIDPDTLRTFAMQNARDLLSHFPKPTATEDLSVLLLREIRAAMPHLDKAIDSKPVQKTINYQKLLRSIERGLQQGSAPWSEWVKLCKEQPEAGLKSIGELIGDIAQRSSFHPMLHADITEYLDHMFSLCAEAMKVYDVMKREMGVLDFTDQEHLLLKVLDHPSVQNTLRDELDLLLVDEFQDTSPIQLALFLKMANCAKAVYWVGDIKQAIYGFRGSDTELMGSIVQSLNDLGGTKEILGSSWRSRPPLVQIVNEVFKTAFADSLRPEEIELKSERKDVPGPTFANWILGGKNKDLQATALASGIKKLMESGYQVLDKETGAIRPLSFGDIAVLRRANDSVKQTSRSLGAFGIPTATNQSGLLATPEAVLTLACLRRLNDASDSIATAEIVSLADCQEPETWVVNRLQHLKDGGNLDLWLENGASIHPLITKLADMRSNLPILAPREALQVVIIECGISERVLRWNLDSAVARTRLANLEAILDMAGQYEKICENAQHAASISGLILWFNEQVAAEQDILAEPAIDAVKVMTHHAAKGLEWPVVILLDLHAKIRDRLWSISATSLAPIEITHPLQNRFIRYWPWPFGAQKTVTLADEIALSAMGKAYHAAAIEEEKRLLYVSMTRARDLLVLARPQNNLLGDWLDTLRAPWLLPSDDKANLVLPSGESIEALRWQLDPVDLDGVTVENRNEVIHWYRTPEQTIKRMPLVLNPSSVISPECLVKEQFQIGERIGVASGTDMESLGNAIHACIAASFTDRNAPLSINDVEILLNGFGVEENVFARAVFTQTKALHEWIAARWADSPAYAEIPVEAITNDSQMIQGRIDLLIELVDGWVLIDHKSNPKGANQWEGIAKEYAGQLATYKTAIERATGKPVLECWIFLPVAAGMVRIDFAEGKSGDKKDEHDS